MFYDNYVKWCNKVNKSPSAVAEEMGMKRSVVTAWKKGRSPHHATMQKVADYFGCSIADLLGEKEKAPTTDGEDLAGYLQDLRERPETRALLEASRGMTKEQVEQMAAFAKAIRGSS